MTITGSNFGATKGTSTVTFNGTTATPSSWSATSIVVPVPSGATTGSVVVTVDGAASNGLTYTVASTPNLTSLSPTSGPVGTSVTIAGTNFGATQGTSTVKFNGTSATPTSWSATRHRGAGAVGRDDRQRRRDGRRCGEQRVDLHGDGACRADADESVADERERGRVVTISGTNFGSTKGTSTVTFNGTTATPTSWSATSIVVPVPSGATTGNVVVTVGGTASNALTFTVTTPSAPTLTSLSPTSGPVGHIGDDQRREFRRDPGHEHGDVQRHGGDSDELVGVEHRGARAIRGYDRQRRRDGRRRRKQRAALYGWNSDGDHVGPACQQETPGTTTSSTLAFPARQHGRQLAGGR